LGVAGGGGGVVDALDGDGGVVFFKGGGKGWADDGAHVAHFGGAAGDCGWDC